MWCRSEEWWGCGCCVLLFVCYWVLLCCLLLLCVAVWKCAYCVAWSVSMTSCPHCHPHRTPPTPHSHPCHPHGTPPPLTPLTHLHPPRLSRDPSSVWFRRPVTADEAPDYATVIARPMDLGTLRDGVRRGQYPDTSAIWADLSLIWDNCLAYNGSDHDIIPVMRKLRAKAERLWDQARLDSN